MLDPADPYATARQFIRRHHTREGVRALLTHGGAFYRYSGAAYEEIEEATLRAEMWDFQAGALRLDRSGMETKPFKPTSATVSGAMDALRGVPLQKQAPCWLEEHSADPPAHGVISLANGLLHVPTRRLYPHTPRFFTLNALPYAYDPASSAPSLWHSFLHQIFDERESMDLLQEWFGYTLTIDTAQQKMLAVIGPPRAGKGVIARVQTELVGPGNVCAPTLSSFSSNFGLSALAGKQLAIIPDARLIPGAGSPAVVERLLSITGEDRLTIDRKFRDPITVQLPTRVMFVSNELPRLPDASNAINSRFLLLRLTKSFRGQEDPGLATKLLEELPGIFLWALEGLDRLRSRGYFVQPESGRELVEEMEDLVSPVSAFIRECCTLGAEQQVARADLFEAWRNWCYEGGRHPGNVQTFGRDLKAAQASIASTRPRAEAGARQRTYTGIGLRPDVKRFQGLDALTGEGSA
jgi:putative DNA primase/helicase